MARAVPLRLPAALAALLLGAAAAAQGLDAPPRGPDAPDAPGATSRDPRTPRDSSGQAGRSTRGTPAAAERDPFQVTPELRVPKRLRDGTMPALTAAASDDWLVQGLMLGARPLAVLVRDASAPGPGRGTARAAAAATTTTKAQRRFVRIGDTLDMPDGRNWRVIAIDREGVLVQGDGAELDTLRIR